MKTSGTCPKCACRKLYVIEEVKQPDPASNSGQHPFVVASAPFRPDRVGLTAGTPLRTDVGRFETWVCANCGLTEWYAKNASRSLEALSRHPQGGVRVVDNSSEGPYR